MDEDSLRRRLARLIETTKAAQAFTSGWWVGDAASERRIKDDLEAGRLAWREAYRSAKLGLAALDSEDRAGAEEYAWMATDHFIAALVTRLRPSDIAVLERPARPRGRPTGSPNVKGRN